MRSNPFKTELLACVNATGFEHFGTALVGVLHLLLESIKHRGNTNSQNNGHMPGIRQSVAK